MWECAQCGERFTTKNQWHSCGKFDLEPLFAGSAPEVRRIFDRLVTLAAECGPVHVIPQRSRIALQARMRFAAAKPQKTVLKGRLILARRVESARFEKDRSTQGGSPAPAAGRPTCGAVQRRDDFG